MSIIYSNANGWIISHEKYFNRIPVRAAPNNDDHSTANITEYFTLNPALFDIWQPYKRRKCKPAAAVDNDNAPALEADKTDIGVKFKHNHVHIAQSLTHSLIQAAKVKKLAFTFARSGSAADANANVDNIRALQIAQDFYQDEVSGNDEKSWSEFYGENNFEEGVKTELNGHTFIIPPRTRFHCRNIESIGKHLNEQKFDLIVLDPPWRNKYIRRRKRKQAEAGYQLLENCKIEEIPIDTLTNENALVVVWCTNCKAHQEEVVKKFFPKWGLEFIHKWYWLKVTQTGEPVIEFQPHESTMKQPFETILIGRKSNTIHQAIDIENIEQNPKVVVSVPSSMHSHKPPLIEVMESQFGINTNDLNCLELFARSLVPGWTSYGNQVLKLQSTQLYSPIKNTK